MKRLNVKNAIKYLIFWLFFVVLFRAKSGLDYEPASVALFSALVFSGQNILILTPLYIAAAATSGLSFEVIFPAALPVAVFVPLYYICYKIRKNPSIPLVCLSALVCRLPIVFFSLGDRTALIKCGVSVLLSVFLTYAFCLISRAVFVRKIRSLKGEASTDEKAALYLLFAAVFLGLYGVEILSSKAVFYAAAAFSISLALVLGGASHGARSAFYAAAVAGIGAAFFDASLVPLSYLVVLAAIGAAARPASVYISAFGIACSFFVLTGVAVGFSNFNIIENSAVLLGAAAAVLIPKKIAARLSSFIFGSGKKDLSERCIVNNSRLASSRKMAGLYRAFADMTSLILRMTDGGDENKILMAAEFGGVAEIFKKLSDENAGVSFDEDFERKIFDSLSAADIPCLDSAVYGNGADVDALVVVNERDAGNPSLFKAVENAVGQRLTVVSADIPYRGAAALEFRAANRFEVVYGEAYQARSGLSGDAKSALKVGGDKFIAALSDGMGHGGAAGILSETAIDLVENFYRAGFTDDALLYLVNRVLCGVNEGAFATLDMCVVDLKKGAATFIKMGAHDGYIRRKGGAEVVESRSLPLGAVDEIKPVTESRSVRPDDLIVMVSDGVGEAFADGELKNLVASSKTKNPQILADFIMSKAVENGVRDDLSVVVLRIFERVN
jgi:hypothetical protein